MRPVNLGVLLSGDSLEDRVSRGFAEIEAASREDNVSEIADGFSIANLPATPVTTLDVNTATATDVAKFLATLIDQFQRRGPSRVE